MKIINFFLFSTILVILWLKHPYLYPIILTIWGVLIYFLNSQDIVSSKKFLACLIIIFLIMVFSVPFQNIIKNNGFEEGIYGWLFLRQIYPIKNNFFGRSKVFFDIEALETHSGIRSLEIVNKQETGNQKYGVATQWIKVNANRSYDISFYVKGEINKGTLWISIRDNWFKEEGRYEVPAKNYIEWTLINPKKKFIVHDSNHAVFKIISTAPGEFYIDDISMRWDAFDTIKRLFKKCWKNILKK